MTFKNVIKIILFLCLHQYKIVTFCGLQGSAWSGPCLSLHPNLEALSPGLQCIRHTGLFLIPCMPSLFSYQSLFNCYFPIQNNFLQSCVFIIQFWFKYYLLKKSLSWLSCLNSAVSTPHCFFHCTYHHLKSLYILTCLLPVSFSLRFETLTFSASFPPEASTPTFRIHVFVKYEKKISSTCHQELNWHLPLRLRYC